MRAIQPHENACICRSESQPPAMTATRARSTTVAAWSGKKAASRANANRAPTNACVRGQILANVKRNLATVTIATGGFIATQRCRNTRVCRYPTARLSATAPTIPHVAKPFACQRPANACKRPSTKMARVQATTPARRIVAPRASAN